MKPSITKEIIETYLQQDLTKLQISKELNISIPTLNKLIRDYKIPPRCNIIRPDIDREWLIEKWINSPNSLRKLAEQEGLPLSTLENRASSLGLKKPFKYNLNKDILFNLQDPNIYYIMGLVATDGYIAKGKNAVELSLSGESELKLLNDIKDYLEIDFPIAHYNSYRLRIACEGLEEFIRVNFNIPNENKTFTLETPKYFPSIECVKAYIRGCFDGDGSYSLKSKRLSLTTASEKFILGLKELIYNYSGYKMNFLIEKRKKGQYPSISVSGKVAQFILEWMYSEKGLKLERKYNKYLKVNDIV